MIYSQIILIAFNCFSEHTTRIADFTREEKQITITATWHPEDNNKQPALSSLAE